MLTPRTRFTRTAAVLAASALVLSACGGGDDGGDGKPEAGASETPAVEPTASTTLEVPEGTELTAPGSQLAFGDTATVAYEGKDQGTLLDLTVESAALGSLKDFQGFDLDDPYKKRGNYYYVRVSVKNTGKEQIGNVAVPLWGISGQNTLLRAVEFKSSFGECPTEPLPADFKPRATFKTCLVFLSPDKGSLAGVSYRPTADFVPIEWHGPVKGVPAKGGKQGGKQGGKKGEKKPGKQG